MLGKCEEFGISFSYDCPKRPGGNELQTFRPRVRGSYVTKVTSVDSRMETV
jgi:hypothetical protein